ncbi:uncharacterized protein CLUP02_02197 [Colletotrichum lupini]|uniref:Uncharacterized protein n=1 Tax=Colletotrichum lupini TaxID=145971 RepID=A0A9Q8SEE2_9PEZI|nr:uncharacterized protein CLUP02_02197 [Colletotrichum lupini]UQC75543.1 hypothetical protein CLUP02_02197 [Colletotrichum lupini]
MMMNLVTSDEASSHSYAAACILSVVSARMVDSSTLDFQVLRLLVNGSCQRQPALDIRPPADDGNTSPARSYSWGKAGRWSRIGDFSSFGSWKFLLLAVRCLPPRFRSSAPSSAFPPLRSCPGRSLDLLPVSPQATLRIRDPEAYRLRDTGVGPFHCISPRHFVLHPSWKPTRDRLPLHLTFSTPGRSLILGQDTSTPTRFASRRCFFQLPPASHHRIAFLDLPHVGRNRAVIAVPIP